MKRTKNFPNYIIFIAEIHGKMLLCEISINYSMEKSDNFCSIYITNNGFTTVNQNLKEFQFLIRIHIIYNTI